MTFCDGCVANDTIDPVDAVVASAREASVSIGGIDPSPAGTDAGDVAAVVAGVVASSIGVVVVECDSCAVAPVLVSFSPLP